MKRVLKFFKDSGAWGVASEFAAFLAFCVGLAEHTHDRSVSAFWWIAVSIPLFWAGAFVAWNKSTSALEDIEAAKPRIILKEPGAVHCVTVQHTFWDEGTKKVLFSGQVPFLRIAFHNDPLRSSPKSVAKGIRAYIAFFPIGHSVPSLQIDGRWAESDQPPEYSHFKSKATLLETSFGIGESHTVDIAYLSATDGKYYAWNNDNYSNINNCFVTPQHLLNCLSYSVQVRLRGEYVDETFKFTFNMKPSGFHFTQPS
jgi:hypothetical protein